MFTVFWIFLTCALCKVFERKVWLFFVMCAWSNPEVCKYTTLKGRLDKHNFAQRIKSQFGFSIIKKRLFFLLNSKHITQFLSAKLHLLYKTNHKYGSMCLYLRSFWGFLRFEQEKKIPHMTKRNRWLNMIPLGKKEGIRVMRWKHR